VRFRWDCGVMKRFARAKTFREMKEYCGPGDVVDFDDLPAA